MSTTKSEEPSREKWAKKMDFLLSCVGYAVGVGNVWRFPYLCYRHGGGAFLIPYVTILIVCGIPVFFLELALGQYHGKGPLLLFKNIAPAAYGLGIGILTICFLIALYYNMIIAWSIFYLSATFSETLEWDRCGHSWNSPQCLNRETYMRCQNNNLIYWNNSCIEGTDICTGVLGAEPLNETHCFSNSGIPLTIGDKIGYVSPSEDYYLRYMLDVSSGFSEYGYTRWQLVLCLFLAWVLIAACLIKGILSSGKVVYFTALFPYCILLILLIRAVTLDGALDGIYFYLVPKWEMILSAQAWGDAATQIFFSIGLGMGSWITLASYNEFHNNCCRDAVLVAILNCSTSLFAGLVIFSALGVMAHHLDVSVDTVVKSGPAMMFVVLPEAVTKMPVSQIWAFLFFLMVIMVGLDTQFTLCEALITTAKDQWPVLRPHTSALVIVVCFICFLLGLPFCAQGGVYLFNLMDWYSGTWSTLIICIFEIISVWSYGMDRFFQNIQEMIGTTPNMYWKVCWKYLSPITLLGILVFNIINYTPASFGSYKFSFEANAFGWCLAVSSVAMIPIAGGYQICKVRQQNKDIAAAFKPTSEWCSSISKPDSNSKPAELDSEYHRKF